MAEWLIAALLKSVVSLDGTGGSNPSPSAVFSHFVPLVRRLTGGTVFLCALPSAKRLSDARGAL